MANKRECKSKICEDRLKTYIEKSNNPHTRAYLLYFYFLYVQRKFENIATDENLDSQSFKEFKIYLNEAKKAN